MQQAELNVEKRNSRGKGGARKLRAKGYIPAVIYGPNCGNVMVTLQRRELEDLQRSGLARAPFLTLRSTEDKELDGLSALIKEAQFDPFTRQYKHLDLLQFDTSKEISVTMPLTFVGRAKGLELGGMMEVIKREITITCLAKDLPHKIEVDVSSLELGTSFKVRNISLGENVRIEDDADSALVAITLPSAAEPKAVAVTEEVVPEEVAAPAE